MVIWLDTPLGSSARDTADCSSCSPRGSGMTLLLRDDAKVSSTRSASHSSVFSRGRRLKASAFVLCLPARCLILKVKLASSDTHRCSTAFSSLFDCRYISGLLSVKTMNMEDIRYSWNYSVTAHLSANSSSFLEE